MFSGHLPFSIERSVVRARIRRHGLPSAASAGWRRRPFSFHAPWPIQASLSSAQVTEGGEETRGESDADLWGLKSHRDLPFRKDLTRKRTQQDIYISSTFTRRNSGEVLRASQILSTMTLWLTGGRLSRRVMGRRTRCSSSYQFQSQLRRHHKPFALEEYCPRRHPDLPYAKCYRKNPKHSRVCNNGVL